ncbi:MAG: metallophosphoesterase family protein [Balneolales bacterium]
MINIGLISDTHNYLDPKVAEYFKECDEIWHAGDFGTIAIADELRKTAPVIGVYGNIDGQDIRKQFPLHQRFTREGVRVWITHIGGQPGRYALPIKREMDSNPPDLFITGHSHILIIARNPDNKKMLHINPGAAGRQGFQTKRTIVLFSLDNGEIKDLKVIELD